MPGAQRKTQEAPKPKVVEVQETPETPQAEVAPEAVAEKPKGYVVADGLSITGVGGKQFLPGDEITAEKVSGGQKSFKQLIDRKCVKKAE